MWNRTFPDSEIVNRVTEKTVQFASEFGHYLATDGVERLPNGRSETIAKLTPSQLRKFFSEVKRQQMQGYDPTRFILLKPKLAYAVGRAGHNSKMTDFYRVMSSAINLVNDRVSFKNFIDFFEAIVAYHKAASEGQQLN